MQGGLFVIISLYQDYITPSIAQYHFFDNIYILKKQTIENPSF